MNALEYRCLECGHTFPSRLPLAEEACPRCASRALESNPWLLRTAEAAGLSPEDYRSLVEVGT